MSWLRNLTRAIAYAALMRTAWETKDLLKYGRTES